MNRTNKRHQFHNTSTTTTDTFTTTTAAAITTTAAATTTTINTTKAKGVKVKLSGDVKLNRKTISIHARLSKGGHSFIPGTA